MEPWPFESTKRSRFHHFGLPGLCLSTSRHSTSAMSAMPMGAPGCPEFAACTASMESARMALARARRVGVVAGVSIKGAHCPTGGWRGQPESGKSTEGPLSRWTFIVHAPVVRASTADERSNPMFLGGPGVPALRGARRHQAAHDALLFGLSAWARRCTVRLQPYELRPARRALSTCPRAAAPTRESPCGSQSPRR